MNEATNVVTKAYAEFYKNCREREVWIHLHAHDCMLMEQFVATLNREQGWSGTYVSLGWETMQLRGVIVQFKLTKEETFLAAQPVIDFALEHGWTCKNQEDETDYGCRRLTFSKKHEAPPLYWPSHHEWKPIDLNLEMRLWVHPDGQRCRKVEAGMQPTYKLVCD